MRAREPDLAGSVDSEGVSIHYEVFGSGPTTVFLMPTFPIVDGRMWKAQVAFLARHFRVVTADPRGNGRSGRPRGAAAYSDDLNAADALAVLDATGTESAFLVALCSGVRWALVLNELGAGAGARPGRDRARTWRRSRRTPRRSRWSSRSSGWGGTTSGPATTPS